MRTPPNYRRQFIYAKDLADLMLWYLLERKETDAVIMATDPADEISIADAARLIADAIEFKVRTAIVLLV